MSARRRTGIPAVGIGVGLAVLALGCRLPQRAPGPMPLADTDPRGGTEEVPDVVRESGMEVTVVRHSDDVRVQQPGAHAAAPLTFYRKRTRLGPGGRVFLSSGGRVELLWPGDASTVVVMGSGALVLGDPRRDQPFVRFLEVSRARLYLTPEDRVELPGGALLRGDPDFPSGPFALELVAPEILRVRNQATRGGRVDYRSASLALGAGDEIDLPLLPSGTRPLDPDPSATRVETGIVDFVFTGRVAWAVEEGRVRVTAEDESEVEALGLRFRLDPGQEVLLAPLETYRPPPMVMGKRNRAEEGEDDL